MILLLLQEAVPSVTKVVEPVQTVADKAWLDSGNILSGIIGGLVAVLVTLVAEFLIRRYEKSQERKEQEIVRFKNETRKITGTIFQYLGPDASVEMMKADLGPPNKQYGTEAGFFEEEFSDECPPIIEEASKYTPRFTAYLYFFQNAHVKVISEDRESIVALTVMAHDETIYMPESETEFLNRYKIDAAFFEDADVRAEHQPGCSDIVTAICTSRHFHGRTVVTTYFCDDSDRDFYSADLKNNPRELIGATVHGVCISKGLETVSYIYLSEIV